MDSLRRISTVKLLPCIRRHIDFKLSSSDAFSDKAKLLTNQINNMVENKANAGSQRFPSFTMDDCSKILHILNNFDVKNLLNYEITKSSVQKLVAWKAKNGPLQHIEDIFLIEGLRPKMIDKFYNSLLHETTDADNSTKKIQRPRTAAFLTPIMVPEQQTSIRTCVSIRVGVATITWARLELSHDNEDTPCLLTHWQHHEINEKKLHLHNLIQRCLYLEHLIPAADCYLFENPQMAQVNTNPGNVSQQNVNIQKAQFTAVISYALAARNIHLQEEFILQDKKTYNLCPNVFYLRRFLSARLFNQLIGNERISSENYILHLMRLQNNTEDEPNNQFEKSIDFHDVSKTDVILDKNNSLRCTVQFPQELRQYFTSGNRIQREFLGQALLLNLAFVRLILIQDPNSIAEVGPKRLSNAQQNEELNATADCN